MSSKLARTPRNPHPWASILHPILLLFRRSTANTLDLFLSLVFFLFFFFFYLPVGLCRLAALFCFKHRHGNPRHPRASRTERARYDATLMYFCKVAALGHRERADISDWKDSLGWAGTVCFLFVLGHLVEWIWRSTNYCLRV